MTVTKKILINQLDLEKISAEAVEIYKKEAVTTVHATLQAFTNFLDRKQRIISWQLPETVFEDITPWEDL